MNTKKDQQTMVKLELDPQTAALFGLTAGSTESTSNAKKEAYLANPKPNTVGWFAPPPPPEEE